MRGSGPSLAASRRSTASHSLTMPLRRPSPRRRCRAGGGRRPRRAGRARAGEQLAQQARGLAGLAVVEVDLGRSQPGLGVVGVGLAPAAVGVERALPGRPARAPATGLQLEDRRVVRRRPRAPCAARASRRAGRRRRGPPRRRRGGAAVSGSSARFVVHGCYYTSRAGPRRSRRRCAPPDRAPCIVTRRDVRMSTEASARRWRWWQSYQPRDPRAKLREVTSQVDGWRCASPGARRTAASSSATTRHGPDRPAGHGWLVGDRRPADAGDRYLIMDDGDVWRARAHRRAGAAVRRGCRAGRRPRHACWRSRSATRAWAAPGGWPTSPASLERVRRPPRGEPRHSRGPGAARRS